MQEAVVCHGLSCRDSYPQFIAKVAEGDFRGAFDIISSANALPRISGRVCPQETQCEGKCVRGIKNEPVAIGRLERFVADWAAEHAADIICVDPQNGHKAAVIGSGPAGLTCAGELARKGFDVTVFEAFHVAGGVLSYGIPEFRLPKSIVASQVEKLKELGVKFDTDMVIGKVLTITELMKEHGYEAVFIASGAGLPQFMHIPGEGHVGVYSANEYLTRINLMKAYDEKSSTPVLKVSPQQLSAAATWLWTRLAAPNVWGPMSTSFIAAVKLNCQHDSKKSITPGRRNPLQLPYKPG